MKASLAAISPQAVEFNLTIRQEKKLSFELLSDPGNKTAENYGITYQLPDELREIYLKFGIDVPAHNGDDSWALPLPARLIIDSGGIIRYAEISADYTIRPDPEHTIEKLKML